MDKRIIAFIALIAVIVIMIGGYVISSSNSVESQISDITGSFDFSSEPVTSWDEDTHEYKFNQNVKTFDKKEFKDISMDILFYKNGKLLDTKTVDINQTKSGSFELDFNAKLDEEPDQFYYNVTSATEL
ncbi:MAG: hypothetical protein Q4Q19_07605 [Methanobrevibacter sp.]|nr:hypothetical protein [Methanobrevibacter sp.]